ncbi:MAG: beta-galactosidase [Armatimonadota bacterium]
MSQQTVRGILAVVATLLTLACLAEPTFLPYAARLHDGDIPLSPQPVMRYELNQAMEVLGIGLLNQPNTAHGALNDGQTFFVNNQLNGVVLPHAAWAKPHAGGPITVLALGNSHHAGDLIALQQRLDGKMRYALIDASTAASNPGGNFGLANPGHGQVYEKLILRRLREINPDVLLVDATVKEVLQRPAVAAAIEQRVKNGMGVVARIGTTKPGPLIPGVIPFEQAKAIEYYRQPSWVLTGEADASWSGIPQRIFTRHTRILKVPAVQAGWSVKAKLGDFPFLLTSELGKGRLAALTYDPEYGELLFPDAGLIDRGVWRSSARYARWMDDLSSIYLKLLYWAAKRDTGLVYTVECKEACKALETVPVTVPIAKSPGTTKYALTLEVSNERREVVYRGQQSAVLAAGTTASFSVPALYENGQYFLDVVARDAGGKSHWWASNTMRVAEGPTLRINVAKDVLRPGDGITGAVSYDGNLGAFPSLALEIELWDSYGRLLNQRKVALAKPFTAGKQDIRYALPYCPARALAVTARLSQGTRVVAYTERELTMPLFGVGDDFHIAMWGTGGPITDGGIGANLLSRLGFDGVVTGPWGMSEKVRNYAWNNLTMSLENGAALAVGLAWGPGGNKTIAEQRWPGHPKYEGEITGIVPNCAKMLGRYGCFNISMANEYQPGKELVSEPMFRDFRAYLKGEYKDSLPALNKEWGTSFATWDEVRPVPSKPEELNFAPGLDVQQFLRKTAARELRRAYDLYSDTMGARVPWGTTSSGHSLYQAELGSSGFGGGTMAYKRMAEGQEMGRDIWNDGTLFTIFGFELPESGYAVWPWDMLFMGTSTYLQYLGTGVVTDFGAVTQRGLWTKKYTEEIRAGAGKLLVTSTMQHDPVAVLYEENTSFTDYTEWGLVSLFAGKDPMDVQSYCRFAQAARRSTWALLRDAQIRPRAVSEKQVQQGRLQGMKVLFLSASACLSDATIQAIEAWVNDGGLLVADLLPGAFDEHGKWRGNNPLDRLFGVEHSGFQLVHYPPEYTLGFLDSAPGFMEGADIQWFYVQFHENGFKVTDGKPLGKHFVKGEAPAFIYKKNGNGAALYLNYLDTEYCRTKDVYHFNFIKALLKQAGVTAPARILDPLDKTPRQGYEITRFTDDKAMHLGIYGGEGDEMTLSLDQPAYLYDVRTKQFLGHGSEARIAFQQGFPRLISCMPCRIDSLKLTVPPAVKVGDTMRYSVTAAVTGQPTSLVFRVELTNPAGIVSPAYLVKVRAPKGQYQGVYQLALNDKPGRWTLKATEIVSGKSQSVAFQVR